MEKKVTIVGAGLVGSLAAVYFAKRGWSVKVYEKRPDLREARISAGKSINLVVSERGWNALEKVGLKEEVEKITVPVYGRMTHDENGETNYIQYSIHNKPIHSVSRGGLNCKLMDLAESYDKVELFFNQKCTDVNLDEASCIFNNNDTGETTQVNADLVIGADGAFSNVRHAMMFTDRFNYQQEYIEHGYKEIHFPSNEDGTPQMQLDALHIWPRKNFMLMGLANLDAGFTGTLFFPFEGEPWSFEKINTEEEVLNFFNQVFPDAVPMIPDLTEQYFSNPTSSLAIIRCGPWHYKNKVMLIGDAAHAIVPFYGEGMNCGFEDCFVLNDLMDKFNEDLSEVLPKYTDARKKNGDAIAALSMRNFIEMRDLVADPEFLLRRKIEQHFSLKHPDKWTPLYTQVKFTQIEYDKALKQGEAHDKIMKQIMAIQGIEEKWNSEEVEQKILQLLN